MPYTVSLVNAHPGGYKPRIYGIHLTWTDSTDPNSASVNVYRATVSGGPYTLIQTGIPVGTQAFDDLNVIGGISYFYVTTEVSNASQESSFSGEVSAVALPIA